MKANGYLGSGWNVPFARPKRSMTGKLPPAGIQSLHELTLSLDAVDDIMANPTFGGAFNNWASKVPDLEVSFSFSSWPRMNES